MEATNSIKEQLKTPVTQIVNNNSFYEKTFAGFSAICILVAGFAAKKTLGFKNLKFDILLSSDLTLIFLSAICCLVHFFQKIKNFTSATDMHLLECFNRALRNIISIIQFIKRNKRGELNLFQLLNGCVIQCNTQYQQLITMLIKLIYEKSTSYYILKNSNFLPPIMFGNGHVRNCFIGPQETNTILKPYYLVQFGIHTYSLCYQVFGFGNNQKYYEFCLHHFLVLFLLNILAFSQAFFLILFSYQLNELRIGALVLFIHEFGDITYPIARVYFEFKNKNKILEAIALVQMVLSWTVYTIFLEVQIFFRTRMIIYPFWIVHEVILTTYKTISHKQAPQFQQNNSFLTIFFSFLLIMLVVIHYYWGIMMYIISYTAIIKRSQKCSYEKLNVNEEKK